MSGPSDLARLTVTIDTANELLLSDKIKMMDVGGGVMRPTNAKAISDLAAQMSGAMVYLSVAAGLAGTVAGGYFSVVAAGVEEYVILYRNEAGTALEIKRYPAASALAAMRELIDFNNGEAGDIACSFLDSNRFTLLKLMVDGALDMLSAKLRNAGDGLEVSDASGFLFARLGAGGSDINGWVTRPMDRPGTEYVDQYGFVFGRVDNNKAYFGPPPSLPPAPVIPLPVAVLDQQQRTDYKQVIEYGQSLSRGVSSIPAISLTQPFANVMLASGVKLRSFEGGYDPSSFVPLVESGTTGEGETPVTGICNGITRRAVAAGESADKWVMVGTSPGRSGKSIEDLSPPPMGKNNDFVGMVKTISDTAALAASLGKTYSVWAYSWDQGETNYISTGEFENSPYQYMQYQLSLFDTLTENIVGITGQKFRPYLFTYQVAAHRKYGRDDMPIALTQWRISRQRADVALAVPCYIFPVAADNLHLTNEGSWLMGEYKSRAIYETMIRRHGKWRPLEPIGVDWKDDHVDIQFHVPRGELVLDAALATLTPNFGFDIREGGVLASNLITSVAINAPGSVRLALSRPAAADATLSYARGRVGDAAHSGPATGARGNLRDTHGLYDTAVSPLGNTFALHNPCVMFEYDRKTGF
ncbi:hypothetical protein [Pseudomonas moorei]|uniref:Sialate O-acetylesterase domain-containing protein n=1 Tax=Pseudomonas moorei TaxID=395599 RepID=A0A1H1CRJ6_9PSED|nr:hypothetical protein [Pseudomonas moorei]KAB0504691.1 hypothetical protein F7R06_13260 [Pseudomonas moorei]SDQ66927.1 hypothetical protein SAMN04490195_1355 [Pseudomonas moorei]